MVRVELTLVVPCCETTSALSADIDLRLALPRKNITLKTVQRKDSSLANYTSSFQFCIPSHALNFRQIQIH